MMRTSSVLTLLFSMIAFAQPVKAANENVSIKSSPLSIGETLTFESRVLKEPRQINIYLPASYTQSRDQRYPVIYLLDGGLDEDFIHIAGLTQFASLSWLNFMPESIVVGIGNVDRKRDFTFKSSDELDQKEFPTSGGANSFISFLNSELRPMISEQYRINATSTLIGQSLGGLLATKILFETPNLFNNYLIISPSLWWDKESLLSSQINVTEQKPNVYIGVGKEGTTMIRLATVLTDKLTQAYQDRDIAKYGYFAELDHGDTLHLAAYQGLKVLFHKEKAKQ